VKLPDNMAISKCRMALLPSASYKSHYQNFTPPFDIPDSWEWVRLEDIAYVASGSTPSKESFVPNGIPYLKMYNLRKQRIDFQYQPQYISEEVHNGKLSRSRATAGDIIMNIVGPPLGKIAIIPTSFKECNFNQAAVMIRPFYMKDILAEYLFNYLEEMTEINCISTKGTAGQVNISLTQAQNMRISLPPIGEIIRINEIVRQYRGIFETLESSYNELTESIAKTKSKILDLAMQGKLVPQDSTDEPATDMLRRINPKARIITDNPHYPQLPDNWAYLILSDINSYKSSTVTPANMPGQLFDLYSVPIFSTMLPEKTHGSEIGSAKQVVKKGDVLLCKINPHLNRVWEITKDSNNIQIASSEWIVVRSEFHHPPFLKWYFNSPKFRTLLSSQVSGVGGSLTRAQPAIVKSYLVPIPPMEEQKRISSAIELWFKSLDSINLSLTN